MASRAMFPSSHPLYRGSFVRLPAAIRGMLAEHDLLVSIGADLFTLSLPGEVDAMPEGMPIVHLDTDPWELGKNYRRSRLDPRLTPRRSLPELTAAVAAAYGGSGAARAQARRTAAEAEGRASLARLRASAEAAAGRSPIHPLALMRRGRPRCCRRMRW